MTQSSLRDKKTQNPHRKQKKNKKSVSVKPTKKIGGTRVKMEYQKKMSKHIRGPYIQHIESSLGMTARHKDGKPLEVLVVKAPKQDRLPVKKKGTRTSFVNNDNDNDNNSRNNNDNDNDDDMN